MLLCFQFERWDCIVTVVKIELKKIMVPELHAIELPEIEGSNITPLTGIRVRIIMSDPCKRANCGVIPAVLVTFYWGNAGAQNNLCGRVNKRLRVVNCMLPSWYCYTRFRKDLRSHRKLAYLSQRENWRN